jgi:hypothetical protein
MFRSTKAILLAGVMGLSSLACQTDPHDAEGYFYAKRGWIDPQAEIVKEGKGPMTFTAPQYGKLFLADIDYVEPSDRTRVPVTSYQIRKGQEFRIEPARDQVWIDEDVTSVQLDDNHTFRLYWLPINQW